MRKATTTQSARFHTLTDSAHRAVVTAVSLAGLLSPAAAPALADENVAPSAPLVREIFVPYDDLNVVLENAGRRVFLTRQEYEALLAEASQAPGPPAPYTAVLLSAEYDGLVGDGRAQISGRLIVDVAADGLQAVPLRLRNTGLRRASLDGQPAAIRRHNGAATLFVSGRGRHELVLEMLIPVEVSAARQSLEIALPQAAASRLRLAVAGDIEVKSGADVLSRELDTDAGVTRFELLLPDGPTALEMSLNNKLAQRQQLLLARNVIVDELTETYERLHVTSSMKVLHGVASRFRFVVPDGFDITHVSTPNLSRWEVEQADQQQVLSVWLRAATNDDVVLRLSAQRPVTSLAAWRMPAWKPLDVVGSVSVVGLFAEDRWTVSTLDREGLLPIDAAALSETLPATLLAADPGAAPLRPVAAFYAPHSEFSLTAEWHKPAARVEVTSNILLIVQDAQLEVRGGFSLLPAAEKIFGCQISAAAGWQVTEVTFNGHPLKFETSTASDQSTRIQIQLPRGVPPGEAYSLHFHAQQIPVGWLDAWQSKPLRFPRFAVVEATSVRGAAAVQVRDDLQVRAVSASGLTPLNEGQKADFNLAEVPTSLAFRTDRADFDLELTVQRTAPRITAETYSFLSIQPGTLAAHYELHYTVAEARTRTLSWLLPADTPAEIAARGLDGVEVKEFSSQGVEEGFRRWQAELAVPVRGTVRLAVSFQLPWAAADQAETSLPIVRATDVRYQSGLIGVEGSAELETHLQTTARKADVGELIAAEYRPGRRLLGVYGTVGEPPEVVTTITRPAGYGLPAAVVERAEVVSAISADGLSQHAAAYRLRIKAPFLEIELPEEATLWSVMLDGQPAKPQQDDGRLLISLPSQPASQLRQLQVVYETPGAPLGFTGRITSAAPRLALRGAKPEERREVPVADLAWSLYLPVGYQLDRSQGTVVPNLQDPLTRSALHGSPAAWQQAGRALLATRWGVLGEVRDRARASKMERSAVLSDPSGGVEYEAARSMSAKQRQEIPLSAAANENSEAFTDRPDPPQPTSAPSDENADRFAVDQTLGDSGQHSVPAPTTPPSGEEYGGRTAAWLQDGRGSLDIQLREAGDQFHFQSLGADPRLDVTVVHAPRWSRLSWGLGLLVLVGGLRLTRHSRSARLRYVLGVLVAATLIPLLLGWGPALQTTFNLAFFAALALLPCYLLFATARWLATRLQPAVPALLLIAAVSCLAPQGWAEETVQVVDPANLRPLTVTWEPPPQPVTVPADAVIVPYDPDAEPRPDAEAGPDGEERRAAVEQIIVPYDKYVSLWNLAHPDRRLSSPPPSVAYALAGAQWQAELTDEEQLQLAGTIDLDVYSGELVQIPIALNGGVLVRAELDGQPARIQLVRPEAAAAQQRGRPDPPLATLFVAGQGRKRLALTLRYETTRRGGWRVVTGRVPEMAANGLTLTIPEPGTEVRLTGVTDRALHRTTAANEQIETAVAADGHLRIEWRPAVAEAVVDRSLTVESQALLDVQEDGLHLTWKLDFRFPLGQRDFFTVGLPDDYLLERVEGDNVRGWEVREGQLAVTLLKAVPGSQQLTLQMALRRKADSGDEQTFQMPAVRVRDASLHEGRITVRRSPLLELRVAEVRGLVRAPLEASGPDHDESVESPLGIRPFQAYRFSRMPFDLSFSLHPVAAQLRAEVQTLVRLAVEERTLETRVACQATGQPIFALQLDVPANLRLDEVLAPGRFQWSVTSDASGQRLRIFLTTGQVGEFSVLLRGTLIEPEAGHTVSLPTIRLPDAARQESTIVVQTDPGLDAQVADLVDCQTVLLQRAHGWLNEPQRKLARLAIQAASGDFSGKIRLLPRTPDVHCQTVSNLRVTGRSFEETILLDYRIAAAGIRELSFLLPGTLRNAKISAPLLRETNVEALADSDQVRVRLVLQDEVMGQYRVLVQDDRLLTGAPQAVAIPVVETGQATRQYVSLESAGRAEVVIDAQQGLEPLSREQQQWRHLAEAIGPGVTRAFLVRAGVADPQLVLRTQDRQAVETSGARILLAETMLTVDAQGAYRGVQVYRLDNRTEQFLQVALPAGATLWAARVAGEPVKPTFANDQLRIPLVKTASGDQDYTVRLTYGGQLGPLGSWAKVRFPLVRSENIAVEESQVRLLLPETHRWFRFGGNMRLAEGKEDLVAGMLNYKTDQLRLGCANLLSENPFAQARARTNLTRLMSEAEALRSSAGRSDNRRLREELIANGKVLSRAKKLLQEQQQDQQAATQLGSNRSRLNRFFSDQSNAVTRNTVNDQISNFAVDLSKRQAGQDQGQDGDGALGQITAEWLVQNGLRQEAGKSAPARGRDLGLLQEESGLPRKQLEEDAKGTVPRYHQQAPELAAGSRVAELKQAVPQADFDQPAELDKLQRFERELRASQRQQFANQAAENDSVSRSVESFDVAEATRLGHGLALPSLEGDAAGGFGGGGGGMAAGPPAATGLASLEVQLPQRGVEFLLTTPRGDLEIVARAVDRPLLERLTMLATLVVGLGVIGTVCRRLTRLQYQPSYTVWVLLLVLGLLLLILGLAPILTGLVASVAALQLARGWQGSRALPAETV